MTARLHTQARLRVAVGPAMPGWGSWEWLGEDLVIALGDEFQTETFAYPEIPEAEVVIIIKHPPTAEWLADLPRGCALVYAPVDSFGCPAEIDEASVLLRRCARIVIHCERLRRFFAPYAPVEYLDHHAKHMAPLAGDPPRDGPLLWVGVRTNLPPVLDWLRHYELPAPAVLLSNWEGGRIPDLAELDLPAGAAARLELWSSESHLRWLGQARAAFDVKGDDFRSRHKPPAKALDFLASGLPLAVSPQDGSSAEHVERVWGFRLARPEEPQRWLSAEYAAETRRLGAAIREALALPRLAVRWARLLREALAEQRAPGAVSSGGLR